MNGQALLLSAIVGTVFQAACPPPVVVAEQSSSSGSVSLDGSWEILFDPENQGREAGWCRDETFSSLDSRRKIDIPSCWELVE